MNKTFKNAYVNVEPFFPPDYKSALLWCCTQVLVMLHQSIRRETASNIINGMGNKAHAKRNSKVNTTVHDY